MSFLAVLAALLIHSQAHGGQPTNEQVRVLLAEQEQPTEVSFVGPTEIFTEQQKIAVYDSYFRVLVSKQNNKWRVKIVRRQNNGRNNDDIYLLKGANIQFNSVAAYNWNQQRLDFPLQVYFQNKIYSIVGAMSMDRYLQGVVEHEMPAGWPEEALKAQAVASRTYAYWKMAKSKKDVFDLRPSVMDQVFRLPRWGMPSALAPRVLQSISATSGQILVDANNQVFKTYFHSDCGGATTTSEKAWGEEMRASHQSVGDRACQLRVSEWSRVWSREQLQRMFAKNIFLPPQSQLVDIIVRTKDNSQRVEWVDLVFNKGIFKRLRGEELRRYLGYDQLKSTVFNVAKRSDGWAFNGRGFGHGVGLCQYGAKVLAKNGESYNKILKHYYPAARLIEKGSERALQASFQIEY